MIISITGGSGSGKSRFARQLEQLLGEERAGQLSLDAYYLNQDKVPESLRGNFDHPAALDAELLCQHLHRLQQGQAIDRPVYDFTTHSRLPRTEYFAHKPIILLDGILTLALPGVSALTDISVFIDTPADIRLARRLLRDVRERGRTPESVISQYMNTVRPMHELYVEPYKEQADYCVDNESNFRPGAQELIHILGL
ncbi:MAG: uridine kinase [Thiolinea sp.]